MDVMEEKYNYSFEVKDNDEVCIWVKENIPSGIICFAPNYSANGKIVIKISCSSKL